MVGERERRESERVDNGKVEEPASDSVLYGKFETACRGGPQGYVTPKQTTATRSYLAVSSSPADSPPPRPEGVVLVTSQPHCSFKGRLLSSHSESS